MLALLCAASAHWQLACLLAIQPHAMEAHWAEQVALVRAYGDVVSD